MNREIWTKLPFKSKYMNGEVKINNCVLNITGTITDLLSSKKVFYWAADSQLSNYSSEGNNLPFHNEEQAFYKKDNIGKADIINRKFEFSIKMPNSYYKQLGSIYIPPVLQISIEDNIDSLINIQLSDGVPFRYLSHPSIKSYASNVNKLYCPSSPYFYNNVLNLPVRSQYNILCSSKYPDKNHIPSNFWGNKPSL